MKNIIGHAAASNCSVTLLKAIGLGLRVRVNNGVFTALVTPAVCGVTVLPETRGMCGHDNIT